MLPPSTVSLYPSHPLHNLACASPPITLRFFAHAQLRFTCICDAHGGPIRECHAPKKKPSTCNARPPFHSAGACVLSTTLHMHLLCICTFAHAQCTSSPFHSMHRRCKGASCMCNLGSTLATRDGQSCVHYRRVHTTLYAPLSKIQKGVEGENATPTDSTPQGTGLFFDALGLRTAG